MLATRVNQERRHQMPMVYRGIDGPGQEQRRHHTQTQPQVFTAIPQGGVYSSESVSEDEQECVFLSAVANALRRLIPALGGNKKSIIGIAPIAQPHIGTEPNVSLHVPGICVSGFTCQNNMTGSKIVGQNLSRRIVGEHRRAASLNNPAISSAAHKMFRRHQRTNSIDGQLYPASSSNHGQSHPQHQLVSIVPLGAGAVAPDMSGLSGLALLSAKPNLTPTSTSAISSRSVSPMDLRSSLPNVLHALGHSDADFQHFASTASFSSASSHSTGTNGSAPLAGEFVVNY